MKKYLVVAYDIRDDKRRKKVCDILMSYGKRTNYSVFECFIREQDIASLKTGIEEHIKNGEDVVLYFPLCRDCIDKIERRGRFREEISPVKFV